MPGNLTESRQFFDSGGISLYGVMHRAVRSSPVVIFCNCLSESHAEWRAEVVGSRLLAARGHTAFAYHPRAHGDSAGNAADVTFEDLVSDAMAAAEFARAASGADRIVWVGTRFGALVAAEAIRRRSDTAAFALWEPVIGAREYFRQLMRHVLYYETARGLRPSMTVERMEEHLKREGKIALLMFDLYRVFSESAIDAALEASLQNWHGPIFLAQFQRHSRLSRKYVELKSALERRGAQVEAVLFKDDARTQAGIEPWYSPERIVHQMGEWLDRM
ncbi:MAG TPA: alpha/beta fold hydrolase [Candidatus Binataceae bacterium]|nr:alpha/beta fold hydrolase [Candidatus Binataceae bacterium]